MWLHGGSEWTEWYTAIRDDLIRRQSAAGYWQDPGVCNEYGTAMALIILQIPNDYPTHFSTLTSRVSSCCARCQSIEMVRVRAAVSRSVLGLVSGRMVVPRGSAARRVRRRSRIPSSARSCSTGGRQSGRLVSLGPGGDHAGFGGGAKHELPLERVFKLTREVAEPVAPLDRSMVVLPDGDRLMRLTLGSATETALEVQSDALGKLSLPLESLLGWIMVVPPLPDDLDGMWDRVRTRAAQGGSCLALERRPDLGRLPGMGRPDAQDLVRRQAARNRPHRDRGGRL